jgi:phenylalanyl-tRNA synthetase beta chain
MKVSMNWLSDFVRVDLSAEELAEKLTMAGLEVEGCLPVGREFGGILVGKILSIAPHPQASKLSVCQVDVKTEVVPIVCGAANIRASDRVPIALPGCVLPNNVGIEKAEIRGEASYGMMCSESELGLGADASGIMILPESARLGEPISSELGLEDWSLDISITPNRGDCLSVLGIAREMAVILGVPLLGPKEKVQEKGAPIQELTSVQIEAEDLCSRYAARVILGTTIVPSPLWIRWRLQTSGIRPISNVVDITNYVMMERGQPLHAFDFNKLTGRRIVVRRAREGETIVTLDGVKRNLATEMLVIADAEEAVAIAGVMGGSTSEVEAETRSVLLESAWFDPLSIRRTSKALGLQSEASYRFERRVDPEGAVKAIDRAAELILATAGGEGAAGVFDAYPRRYFAPALSLRVRRANRILGTSLSKRRMIAIMKGLQFPVLSEEGEEIRVAVPSFRGDMRREIDLIEEVARIAGFDRIPKALPQGVICPRERSVSLSIEESVRRLLCASGFFEVVNFSFTRPEVFDRLQLKEDDPLRRAVRLQNPLSEDAAILRTLLLPSLLEDLRWNENRSIRNMKIFEIARTFHSSDSEASPHERKEMAAIAVGQRTDPHWAGEKGEVDFFFLKGIAEALGNVLGLTMEMEPIHSPYLHPGKSARIEALGQRVGWIGQIHPEVAEGFGLAGTVFGFGLEDLELISSLCRPERQYSPLPRFPAVVRDVALQVPSDVPCTRVHGLIRKAGGNLVDEVKLFDVYQGEKIPHGHKSLAFSIHYRAADRTLTDEEVNGVHSALLQILKQDLGAEIR